MSAAAHRVPDSVAPVCRLRLPSPEATARLAVAIAPRARPGDVVALAGDLGSGKTTFARAFITARLGHEEEVPSPTFTLVQVYEDGCPIWHVDLYRLAAPEEAMELGLEEAFASAIALIEWPERLGALLPSRRLLVALAAADDPDARWATIDGGGDWPERLRDLEAEGGDDHGR